MTPASAAVNSPSILTPKPSPAPPWSSVGCCASSRVSVSSQAPRLLHHWALGARDRQSQTRPEKWRALATPTAPLADGARGQTALKRHRGSLACSGDGSWSAICSSSNRSNWVRSSRSVCVSPEFEVCDYGPLPRNGLLALSNAAFHPSHMFLQRIVVDRVEQGRATNLGVRLKCLVAGGVQSRTHPLAIRSRPSHADQIPTRQRKTRS